MNITRSLYDITIDGDPKAVRRLIVEIGQWPELFPHIHAATRLRENRWKVGFSWCWLPVSVVVAQRVADDSTTVEQRFGTRFGLRIACHWTIRETRTGETGLRVHVESHRGPVIVQNLLHRSIFRGLIEQALDQICLLAESDRKAHQNIA